MNNAPGDEDDGAARPFLARRGFRFAAWTTVALSVIGLFGFWYFSSSTAEPTSSPTSLAAVAAPPPHDKIAKSGIPDPEELPEAVRRFVESTVYPPGTGRLTEAQEDLLHPNRRYEDYRRVIDTYSTDPNEVVSVRLTTSQYFFTGDEAIELTLHVRRGSHPILPLSVETQAEREGRSGSEGDPIPVRFHRKKNRERNATEAAGLVAKLDPARLADHHGPVLVRSRIEYARGQFYDETLRFFYTPTDRIPARFTGEFRDALRAGSLEIGIGIDVDRRGFYRLDANLYDAFGSPIGFSAFKGNLNPGAQFVPIQFFGRVLRDVGASGPYRVGEVRGYRFLESEYPDREPIPELPGHFLTANYDVDGFSSDEFTSEHKERMVQLLLEDLTRGISIEQPPMAQPAGVSPSATELQ